MSSVAAWYDGPLPPQPPSRPKEACQGDVLPTGLELCPSVSSSPTPQFYVVPTRWRDPTLTLSTHGTILLSLFGLQSPASRTTRTELRFRLQPVPFFDKENMKTISPQETALVLENAKHVQTNLNQFRTCEGALACPGLVKSGSLGPEWLKVAFYPTQSGSEWLC